MNKNNISLGLAGCGYWGPNLLRNFHAVPQATVRRVADVDTARLEYIRTFYPLIETTPDTQDLFADDIDAVVIATPARTHYALARAALEHGKHVFVEKPLAMTAVEARELICLAEARGLQIMTGHTFEYNAAVRYLKRCLEEGALGKPYYFYAQRLNLGVVRSDINALWNLAPHDISILLYLLGGMPEAVSAAGRAFLQTGIEDVVFLTLYFPGGVFAHVHVSWLDPNKVRRLTVVGSEKMIVYDDVSDAKIQIFDKGIKKQNLTDSLGPYDDFGKFQLIKVAGDVVFPKIDFTEPLKTECRHFVDCIRENRRPQSDGESGLRVVQVLEAAQQSLASGGERVAVNGQGSSAG